MTDIKLIIFDLDGVLFESKNIHFEALNQALADINPFLVISYNDHIKIFDGLPTEQKLKLLESKGLKRDCFKIIKEKKNHYTNRKLDEGIKFSQNLFDMFSILSKEYKIHVASNAIRTTVEKILWKLGIREFVNFIISNEDVINTKPHPEMYLRCMIKAEVSPSQTLILEDSYIGRKAVLSSGAKLCPIKNPEDVTLNKIYLYMQEKTQSKWHDDKLNVLIPMAGKGSRFAQAGYTFPKPLIECVDKKPMIQLVVENLAINAHFIFIVQKEHYDQYNLRYLLTMISPKCDIVTVDTVTEGAACTTLLAKDLINNNKQLLIANSDQYIEWDSSDFFYNIQNRQVDGSLLTFENLHPKWSYAKVENGFVIEVAEKKPISNIATCGIYYWSKGSDYVKYAESMINKNVRTNNEFYIAPVYNEAILDGKKITNYEVKAMYGLGTPEDLEEFTKNFKK